MTGINITLRRIISLQKARDKATNPEFKELWDQKLQELIKLAEQGRSSYDSVH